MILLTPRKVMFLSLPEQTKEISDFFLDMARYMTDWGKNVFDVFDVFRI